MYYYTITVEWTYPLSNYVWWYLVCYLLSYLMAIIEPLWQYLCDDKQIFSLHYSIPYLLPDSPPHSHFIVVHRCRVYQSVAIVYSNSNYLLSQVVDLETLWAYWYVFNTIHLHISIYNHSEVYLINLHKIHSMVDLNPYIKVTSLWCNKPEPRRTNWAKEKYILYNFRWT